MKILIIGGRSFIGRTLVNKLLKKNHSLIIGSSSNRINVLSHTNGCETVYLNLFDESSIRGVISVHKPSVISF